MSTIPAKEKTVEAERENSYPEARTWSRNQAPQGDSNTPHPCAEMIANLL